MDTCKYCGAEIHQRNDLCPSCGKNKYSKEEIDLAYALEMSTGLLHTILKIQKIRVVRDE